MKSSRHQRRKNAQSSSGKNSRKTNKNKTIASTVLLCCSAVALGGALMTHSHIKNAEAKIQSQQEDVQFQQDQLAQKLNGLEVKEVTLADKQALANAEMESAKLSQLEYGKAIDALETEAGKVKLALEKALAQEQIWIVKNQLLANAKAKTDILNTELTDAQHEARQQTGRAKLAYTKALEIKQDADQRESMAKQALANAEAAVLGAKTLQQRANNALQGVNHLQNRLDDAERRNNALAVRENQLANQVAQQQANAYYQNQIRHNRQHQKPCPTPVRPVCPTKPTTPSTPCPPRPPRPVKAITPK